MMDFENKTAIVTGTTGIGKAIAIRLARGGARVLACGIDKAANKALEQDAIAEGITLEVRQCDVSSLAIFKQQSKEPTNYPAASISS